jgi:hypothetical protein
MKENLYSRNEIVDAALMAWGEDPTARDAVYKQVERTLKENKIKPDSSKRGRALLYPIDDLSNFVREKMFDYFVKGNKGSKEQQHAARGIGETHLNDVRGHDEDSRRDGANQYFEAIETGKEDEWQKKHYDESWKRHKAEELFVQRKYQIMLEALFDEKFDFMADALKNDINDYVDYLANGNPDNIRNVDVALVERYADAKSYYREKRSK